MPKGRFGSQAEIQAETLPSIRYGRPPSITGLRSSITTQAHSLRPRPSDQSRGAAVYSALFDKSGEPGGFLYREGRAHSRRNPRGERQIEAQRLLHDRRGGGAFRTQDVYDPQLKRVRGAVEIHMNNQSDIHKVETAGCYGIPRDEWPEAKAAIQKFIVNHPEGATLRIHTDGSAEIVSRNSRATTPAAPVSRGNRNITDYVDGAEGAPQQHMQASGDRSRQRLLNRRAVHPQLQGQSEHITVIDNTDGNIAIGTQLIQ